MNRMAILICMTECVFALSSPVQAGKTAVIPCTRTPDGKIRHEQNDMLERAKQFAITDPRFFRINQFRKSGGVDQAGDIKGTCIIDFISEDEFNLNGRE